MDDYALLADEERQARDNARTVTPDDVYAGMAADEAANRDNALKASLRQAVPVSPDAAAKSKALSTATGVPMPVVDRNTEAVAAQARVQELQKLAQQSPVLARQLADPEFAKLSHDDAENLSLFERTFKTYLGASVKSGLESLVGTGIKLVDALNPFTLSEADAAVLFKDKPEELAAFMRDNPSVALTRFTRAMQQASEATMQGINPDAKVAYGDLKYATLDPSKAAYLSPIKVVGDAIQSLPTTLALAVTVYLTKGTAARVEAQALEAGVAPELARQAAVHAAAETMAKLGAATEGAAGFAQQSMQTREQADRIPDAVLQGSPEYQRLIAQGYSPEAARTVLSALAAETAGAAGGSADAVVNYFGGSFLGRIITEGGALLKRAAGGFATEALTEAAQGGLEQLGQNKAVQAFMDPHQELLDGVAEQIAQGFVVGGVMGGTFSAVAGRKRRVEQAAGNAAALQKLFEVAAADKLRERSPADFAAFVQGVAEESGTPAVFIDAATFAQAAQEKGLDIAAAMPETAKQIEEAIATKGDVRIPLGELTAALPGTGLENTLMQHMRTSIDGPTLAETQDKKFAEETQAEVAKVMAENEFTTAHKESAAVVERELAAQLTAANRFTKDVNDAYAKLMASFYAVQAARLNITPEEMYVKYPLHIQAERVVKGASMDQLSTTALLDQAIEIAGEARFQTLGERALLEARAQAAQTNAPFGEAERAVVIENLAQRIVAAKESGSTIFGQPAGWDTAETHDPSSPDPLKPNVGSRGLYNVDTRTISLLKNADLSTFLHESGHFYLEMLTDIASQPDAPAEIVADMQHVLDWFGVPTLANWREMKLEDKRPYHERFARGFEAYLFEGKSPNQELAVLFARFRAWMLNVYRQLVALNVELSDEMRKVFDRMLATNDEILAAEAARAYAPLFKSAAEMGATPEEWKAYQEQSLDATHAAVAQLEARSLRDMQWLSNAKGRALRKLQKAAASKRKAVEAEVTTEVRGQPVYAALRFLSHGELPETHRTNAERALLDSIAGLKTKLSMPDLKAIYGDGPAAPWRYLNTGKFGTVAAEDGVSPEMVAELFGFTSGDELVRKILAAEPEATVIEGMTDQRMLERYGDLSSPEAIEQAANEAIHNEARAKFMATELRALAKATGQKNILAKAAKEFAATIIGRKKLREISPAKYAAAEARAGRAAERAKSFVEKATEKRNQIVNHYATRAAYDAIDEIQKGIAYLRRVGESKTIDPDYREQINALLERFDLRKTPAGEAARRASLLQWVEDQRSRGFEPVIDAELLNEAKRMPYQEMPLEEFRGLVDAVKNIEHLGRLKHKLLTLADQREFAAVVGEAADAIEANAKKTIPTKLERNTWLDKMKSGVAEFFAMHRKFALMIREMDGHADNGVLWNLLVKPMNDAGNTEAVMREKATIDLEKLLKTVGGKLRGEKLYIPEIRASLSREGRIMVALNTGNAGNLQRLMDGDGWSREQVQAIVNTLTKTEMDFVQSVWDFVGGYRDEIGAQQRRLTGVDPEWVQSSPVQTIHGEYRGGYIPAKYDTTRSTRSLSDEAAAGVMDMWRAERGAAKTRDSFTKGRADKVVDRPLRKDFGVITQHITEVTHRLAWQEYLIDAQRLLRAAPIDKAIRDHYGPEVLRALRDTIKDVAAGEVAAQSAFESGMNYLRTGATIAGLGWRLTTSLLQPLGLTQSMVRIGPMYVARGMVEWLGDAAKMENTAKRIFEKSHFMRLRAKTMQREISEIRNQVNGKASAIEASYFYLIQKMQLVADIPTWLGQYHKAVEHGADEAGAVAQADQAVLDAQGGGQIKDLAAIQRGGPLLKLFTNFYSFFNTTYNLTGEAVGRTKFKDPISVGRLAVDLLLLYSVPAALGTLLKAALHSGDDGADDEKKLMRQLIADQLTYLFGTIVGLREIAGGIQTAAGLPGDYQGPASVRLFAELAKLGKQAGQGDVDEALLKAANNTAGILFHYPAGQIGATLDGIVTMANGKTENPGALLVGSNKK